MGSHTNCRDWDYENHPNALQVVQRTEKFRGFIERRAPRIAKYGVDTRPAHAYVFKNVTPAACDYLAGNYRGSSFVCLTDYRVGVGADSRVGVEPILIAVVMASFNDQCQKLIDSFIALQGAPKQQLPAVVLARAATILAEILEQFLTIHPYANGNGHAARLLVGVLLGRFGYPPKKWPFDHSPNYGQALTDHRDGNKTPLIAFILQSI
jgi:hypothetical protein